MIKKNFAFAAWACIINAALVVPIVLLSFYSTAHTDSYSLLIALEMVVHIVYIILFVVMYSHVKYLLNDYFSTSSLDSLLHIFIGASIAISALTIIAMPFPEIQAAVSLAVLALMIPYGIVFTVLGIKLLNLEIALHWKNALAALMIIGGVCTATIILLPVSLLASLAGNIILAVIFFDTASRSQDGFYG